MDGEDHSCYTGFFFCFFFHCVSIATVAPAPMASCWMAACDACMTLNSLPLVLDLVRTAAVVSSLKAFGFGKEFLLEFSYWC